MESAAKSRLAFQDDKAQGRRSREPTENFIVISPEKASAAKNPPVSHLLIAMEQRLRGLRLAKNLSAKECAEEILTMLRELVRFENGAPSLDVELPHFFHTLWAEASIRKFMEVNLRRARNAVDPRATIQQLALYQPREQLAQMAFLLEWYAQRKATLRLLDGQNLYDACAVVIQGVVHDQTYLGERGFEIVATARVDGLESQTLWLSAMLFSEGAQLSIRPGWEYWADDGELFIVPHTTDSARGDRHFASFYPLTPRDQRAIYHGVRLFVPYAALALSPKKRHQIDCEVSLLSSNGAVLCADACSETISLPLSENRGAVPSPSALGFWPRNIGGGDAISITKCETQRKVEARRDVYSLKVDCDLMLVDRQDDSLQVELRLLTREGALIESELPSYRNRDGAFVFRSTVTPQEIVAHYPSLQCVVPLIALELDAGVHDLFAEVIIFDREKSIVCGDICEISIDMPIPIPGQRAEIEEIRSDVPIKIDSPLFVEQIVIDSGYLFNSRDALRIEVIVFDQSPGLEPMQSRLSLGANDGATLARGLGMLRKAGESEHALLYVFDCDEVLKIAGNSRELTIHFELLNQKGEMQLSTTRNIFLSPHFGLEKGVPSNAMYGRNEVEIVDLQMRETPQRGGELMLQLRANFDMLACEKQSYALYVEPLRTPKSAKPEPGLANDGFYVEFPLPKVGQQIFAPMKLLQESQLVRVPYSPQNSGAYGLKLMLLAPSGRLLQVVYQKFSVKKNPV